MIKRNVIKKMQGQKYDKTNVIRVSKSSKI